jgi:D-alanyl-D-alanine carboxypeptidase/D-alanyl-D-alanine-endopeptidase (penicillin-binding protein 4)
MERIRTRPRFLHPRSSAFIGGLILATLSHAANLETRLDQILDAGPLSKRSLAGVQVVSLDTHKILYASNADRFFVPASNMKLFTTALALTRLGPDYRFVTRLLSDSSGNLVLAGGGDPSLSGRDYPYRKEPTGRPPLAALEQLLDEAIASGLKQVDGDIIGDDTLYPWVPYPPNWSQDDALGADGAPVSALTLNDNVIALRIRAGDKPGDPVGVTPWPAVEYFSIDNRIVTGELRSARHIEVSRIPGSRQILLSGSIPAASPLAFEGLAVDDPALFAACALYDVLSRRGVEIRGVPLARHRSPGEVQPPAAGRLWATRTSPPLSELLQVLDKVSQNLHAELMLREVGRIKGSDGTRESGMKVMETLMRDIGAPADEVHVDDGSGLSRNAEVTPRLVTRLLSYMAAAEQKDVWMSLLPVGGEDGTLSHRLCCTSDSRNIQAKTGTLSRAVALSGYADSKTGGKLAFSILVNNFGARTQDVQVWVDKIALALLE